MSRPKVRTLLILMNFSILLLPVASILLLKLYENALLRQTEAELITQGAYIAAMFEQQLQQHTVPTDYGLSSQQQTKRWQPKPATLDLLTAPIWPRPHDAEVSQIRADPIAQRIGQHLTPILKRAQITTLAGIRVVDFHGIIIASTRGELGYSLAHRLEIQQALQGHWVRLLRQRISDEPQPTLGSMKRGTKVRVFVGLPILSGQRLVGAVLLSRTPYSVSKALYQKRYTILATIMFTSLLVIALSILGSLAISRPISAVVQQTQRAIKGEKGAVTPLSQPVTYEVEQLSNAVASMAETIEHRSDYIRSFTAHVSHEFKTPLTSMRGTVELMQDYLEHMSPQEKNKFLGNMESDILRLQDLVNALFQLAKADVMKMGQTRQAIQPLLAALITEYTAKGLSIDCDLSALAAQQIGMDENAFTTVFGHLLDNAMRYSPGSPVTISTQQCTPASLKLRVADDGPGISENHAEQIFEPFFTTGREIGGTGLGLNIVRAIMTAHHGDIQLEHTTLGASFLLTFTTSA